MSKFFYIVPLLSLFWGLTTNAEVILKYDFDRGYNVDNVSGTTAAEGSADDIKNNPGLLPSGLKNPALIPGKQVDPLRAFAAADAGKALLTGVDKNTGKRIDYSVKLPQALSAMQGAVSFYITPIDWSGNELGKFHNFVALYSADRQTNIMIYKYHDRRMIFVNIANGKKNQSLRIDVSKWTPGEKHFVAFLWNKNNSSLYVDGQVVSRQLDLPEKPLTDMRIGSFGWGTEQGLSLIDDLTCYGSKVDHNEIVNVYSQGFSLKSNRQAPVRIQLNKKTAKIDGQITPGEYSFESNLGFDLITSLVTFQVKWYLARDDKNLYFAVKRPRPSTFQFSEADRDEKIWRDDSTELIIFANKTMTQIAANSKGAVYDAKNNDKKFNFRNLQIKNTITQTEWIQEIALPLSEIGDDAVNQLDLAFCSNLPGQNIESICASPLKSGYTNKPNYIAVEFKDNAPSFVWNFNKMPGVEAAFSAELTSTHSTGNTLNIQFFNDKKRIELDKTINIKSTGVNKLDSNKTLSPEGRLKITLDGRTVYDFPVVSARFMELSHLRTDMKKQVLEAVFSIKTIPAKPQTLVLRLRGRNKTAVQSEKNVIIPAGYAGSTFSAQWNLSKLPAGDYDFDLYKVSDDKKLMPLHHQWFFKPAGEAEWENYTGGSEDTVPAPWNKPTVNGNTFRCLMQSYTFDGKLFPTQIIAEKNSLLDESIYLLAAGKKLDIPAQLEIIKQANSYIEFCTKGEVDNLKLRCDYKLYFDGYLECKFSYSPANTSADISDMYLVIPMNEKHSALANRFRDGTFAGKIRQNYTANLFDWPFVWVGNASNGLFFGADNFKGTHIYDTRNTLKILKNGNKANVHIKFADRKFTLKGTRTISFGLEATPPKPIITEALKYPWMDKATHHIGSCYQALFDYNDLEAFDDPQRVANTAEYRKNTTGYYMFFTTMAGCSPYWPQWPWYVDEWTNVKNKRHPFKYDVPFNNEKERNNRIYAETCMRGKGFINFKLYNHQKLMDNPLLKEYAKHFYFDIPSVRICYNDQHGCSWYDDFGRQHGSFGLTKGREYFLRFRRMLQSRRNDGLMYAHATLHYLPPVFGLCDMIADGEYLTGRLVDSESFFKEFSPDYFQASINPAFCGAKIIYLCEFERATRKFNPARIHVWQTPMDEKHTTAVRHFLGYMLLHNIGVWPSGTTPKSAVYPAIDKINNLMKKFSVPGNRFTPYYGKNHPARVRGDGILASYYQVGKDVLAVIMNDKDRAVEVTVTVPAKATVQDAESEQIVNCTNNRFVITVPPRNMKLYIINLH